MQPARRTTDSASSMPPVEDDHQRNHRRNHFACEDIEEQTSAKQTRADTKKLLHFAKERRPKSESSSGPLRRLITNCRKHE
ncbi:hypothetical protein BST61_g11443 [Cercospora zeina]